MPTKISSTSTSPPCSEHRPLNWYRPNEPVKHLRTRYAIRSRHADRLPVNENQLAERRSRDYVQAFARLLTTEDKAVLRQAKVASEEPTLEERFYVEAAKWQRETAHLSSPLQRMMHPSYQAILGMAAERKQDIIRLMLDDMRKTRRDWLLALSYLTQVNPVNSKDAGKTDKLIEAWIKWGKEQGLLHT
jgi:hypothetical protein